MKKKTKPIRARRTPKVTRTDSPAVTKAAARLGRALARMSLANGDAQWTNGYRCARFNVNDPAEDKRLHDKEMLQLRFVGQAEWECKLALAAYARAIWKAAK